MFRLLVRAVTGLGGDDYYKHEKCVKHPAVTCKTHWPSIGNLFREETVRQTKGTFHDKAMVLVRNPRNALPSYFNYLWERKHHLQGHSEQAPERKWQSYRDQNFDQQLKGWKGMFTKWQQQPFEIALYIQYEHLTSEMTGPALLKRIVNIIRNAPENSINVAPNKDIPCLWYKVVKEGVGGMRTKRAAHTYTPAYTYEQKHQMLQMLDGAMEEFSKTLELVEIIQSYRDDVAANMPLEPLNYSSFPDDDSDDDSDDDDDDDDDSDSDSDDDDDDDSHSHSHSDE